jgi:hypothetical protein
MCFHEKPTVRCYTRRKAEGLKAMHRDIKLGIPHAIGAKRYLDDGKDVVHVWTDLSPTQTVEIEAFETDLIGLRNSDPRDYDKFVYYLKE